MPCVKRSLLALAVVAFFTFFPKVTFAAAQATCECFCGSDGTGAVDADQMTNSACRKTCADTNTQFVGCFSDPQEYPDRSPKCWTQDQCESWSGYSGTTLIGASWGDGNMPYDCAATKTSGLPQKYCYADDAPYTLNVAIGGVTEVANIPTYINDIYAWLLPAASLVAVVMMMIGGLQYVMSRGKSKYIEKAKTRITNAITGLVILLCIFVLLNLIDPRLTSLNTLRVPMIKEVTLLTAESSCERLTDADVGYTVTLKTGTTACGGTGTVSGTPVEGTIGSWKEGDLCNYTRCKGADEGKVCVANGGTYSCQSCSDIPSPSVSSCTSAEQLNSGPSGDTQMYCEYNETQQSCTTAGTNLNTMEGFYCGALRTAAAASESGSTVQKGCGVYEDLEFAYNAPQYGGLDPVAMNVAINSAVGSSLLEKICTADPCHIAKDVVHASRCAYSTSAVTKDFWGISYAPTTTGYFCRTF